MGSVVLIPGTSGGDVISPVAEVGWTCACGTKVKAVLDMTKASVTVQCPIPPCKVTRTLLGQIKDLSVETELGVWRAVDLNRLIYPAD